VCLRDAVGPVLALASGHTHALIIMTGLGRGSLKLSEKGKQLWLAGADG
jgi:hypothetical protein